MSENFERKGNAQEKFKQCPDCNTMNNSDQNYCVDCGAELPLAGDENNDSKQDSGLNDFEDYQDEVV